MATSKKWGLRSMSHANLHSGFRRMATVWFVMGTILSEKVGLATRKNNEPGADRAPGVLGC
jgi:hypothetical protein